MASDDNNPGGWKVPKGFTLTRIPGHRIDARGMAAAGSDPRRGVMPDGAQTVAHFVEDEPFVWKVNDGQGEWASDEAKKAALAGKPLAGWHPNVFHIAIEDSWVPDQYTLTLNDDPTPVTEPANVVARELTPDEEAAKLRAAIESFQARIAEIEGAAS